MLWRAVGLGKEAAEGGVVRQVRKRCELQLVERDVRGIEIDGRDVIGAAAR